MHFPPRNSVAGTVEKFRKLFLGGFILCWSSKRSTSSLGQNALPLVGKVITGPTVKANFGRDRKRLMDRVRNYGRTPGFYHRCS